MKESFAMQLSRTEEKRRAAQSQESKKASKSRKKTNRRLKQLAQIKLQREAIVYGEYLKTNWWKSKRRQKLDSTKHLCERCGGKANQVHHKHYRTLWREKNADLESICGDCHVAEHEGLIQSRNHMEAIARQQ